ncbi:MAG: GNAT family N-acetyltransferase [Spongiibacteraceae bacterium]
MIEIRNAALADLPAIAAVQHLCYDEHFLESHESFHSKLTATATTCWLALRNDKTLGYLITLPVSTATFPALDAPAFEICARPELLYIHDLAITPEGRAFGLGKQLLECAQQTAIARAIPRAGLIAVQASADYWTRHGFVPVDASARGLSEKVASFGDDACYMEKSLR